MGACIERIDLDNLKEPVKSKFSLLAPPKYRCCLNNVDPDGISFAVVVAIGAFENGEPVGLALASYYDAAGMGEIFNVQVSEHHRHRGIGTALLKEMEDALRQEKATFAIGYYRKDQRSSEYLERILRRLKWKEPALFMVRYFFDCYTFCPPWFENPPQLPKDYTLFDWEELTDSEKDEIESLYKRGHFDTSVHPLQLEETWEKINSVGLRYKGLVIGWMITHRLSADTIRYSALYVKPAFQYKGLAVNLLVCSIKKQQASPVRWSVFELNVLEVEPSWIRFVTRRLAPYAVEEDKIYQIWKYL